MDDVAHFAVVLTFADDSAVTQPLWELAPRYRMSLLHERRRRNLMQGDPEPSGDPEFS